MAPANMPKFSLKTKKILKDITQLFWRKLTLFLALFLFFAVLSAGLFVWSYYFSRQAPLMPSLPLMRFNQALLDEFVQEFRAREERFDSALSQDYLDPFKDFRFSQFLEGLSE